MHPTIEYFFVKVIELSCFILIQIRSKRIVKKSAQKQLNATLPFHLNQLMQKMSRRPVHSSSINNTFWQRIRRFGKLMLDEAIQLQLMLCGGCVNKK